MTWGEYEILQSMLMTAVHKFHLSRGRKINALKACILHHYCTNFNMTAELLNLITARVLINLSRGHKC